MTNDTAAIAIYDTHRAAEDAVKDLQRAGFDMKKLSIVGKDYHSEEQVVGYYNSGDRMKYWGTLGAFWGSLWGLLLGWAVFFVPGIGPVLAAGPVVGAIVAALEGAAVVGGLSALGAGLYGLGIPKDSILRCEVAIKADKFLLIAHGTREEVARVRNILRTNEMGEPVSASGTPVSAGA
jgi:uncharacterized membrane protein